MKTPVFSLTTVLFAALFTLNAQAQNVGIGESSPPAKLTVLGTGNSPAIPGPTSTGILRITYSSLEGFDIGKLLNSPYSAWMQSGYDGTQADPISLAPLGGNVGIGTLNPSARFHVYESGSGKGVVFQGAYQSSPADPPVSGSGTRLMWYPDKASFRVGRVSSTRWDADSVGAYSFASNYNTRASGQYSVASGNASVADGDGSFAGGYKSKAMGDYSFSFGYNAFCNHEHSVAIGYNTTAWNKYSFVFGRETKTYSAYETSFGSFNEEYTPVNPLGWSPSDRLFVVGFGVFEDARCNALTIIKGGQTGFRSMTTPTYTIHLANINTNDDGKAQAYAWDTYSDIRIKSDIHPISYGLDVLMKLQPIEYFHHNSIIKNRELIIKNEGAIDIGFVAQDVYQLIPEVVSKPEDESISLWGMSYERLVPVLVKAIQEQQAMISSLEQRIEELEVKDNNEKWIMNNE